MWVSNGWVQFSAFLLCAVAWLIAGRDSVGALWKVEPRYVLLGGVIGCRDHMDCESRVWRRLGPDEVSTSDRDIAVDRSICDRTSRVVWSRQRTAGNTQNYWYVHCPDWCCNFFNGNSTINSLGICGDYSFRQTVKEKLCVEKNDKTK